jgi:hypothetical protein
MIYVLDTSAFRVLRHYYPKRFPSLWDGIEELIKAGEFVSVREVLREIEDFNEEGFLSQWIKDHKAIFRKPDDDETKFVANILAVRHFQSLIGKQNLLKGKPVADPFVVAAAQVHKGTVVTEERHKPNAAKIPNVCEHFEVPCVSVEGFMDAQGWSF